MVGTMPDRYLSEEGVLAILDRTGAVLTNGHFVYTSGRHGSAYVNKDAVYPHVDCVDDLCQAIAYTFRNSGIDVVVAPELGGVILQFATAGHLRVWAGNHNIYGVYAEKVAVSAGRSFTFNRGYGGFVSGKRVLVVDDVLTTGGSVKAVVRAVREAGGQVVGVAVLCNRGGVTAEQIGVPELFALCNVSMNSWPAENCPLCKNSVPVNTETDKGRQFVEGKRLATV